jgi:AraC family transcriptional regulator, positive regulator of tynA and feaB
MDSDPDSFDEMTLDQVRFPGRDTFEVFQETIAEFPVRCSFEYTGEDPFYTQWVATQSAGAAAVRWSCAAHTTRRTEHDIANSAPAGYAALYALSGGARIVQDGREIVINPGSAAIYDLDRPLEVDMLQASSRDFMMFTIPRSIAQATAPSEPYKNPLKLLTGRTPLFQCIDYMSRVLATRSVEEREYVFNACASLFTAELLSAQRDDATHARGSVAARDLFDQILYSIDLEIGNPELTPQWLADRFGVSPRYIHKLFAAQGLTCQTYITHARLRYARHDLINSPMKIRIATLAYRWGFSDPSSFGRAFRNLFGHSPGVYKNRKR